MKIISFLFGLAIIALGVRTIWLREAKWDDSDSNSYRIIEGFPAILFGLAEVASGLVLIFHK